MHVGIAGMGNDHLFQSSLTQYYSTHFSPTKISMNNMYAYVRKLLQGSNMHVHKHVLEVMSQVKPSQAITEKISIPPRKVNRAI